MALTRWCTKLLGALPSDRAIQSSPGEGGLNLGSRSQLGNERAMNLSNISKEKCKTLQWTWNHVEKLHCTVVLGYRCPQMKPRHSARQCSPKTATDAQIAQTPFAMRLARYHVGGG